jgi:hypothetical protein
MTAADVQCCSAVWTCAPNPSMHLTCDKKSLCVCVCVCVHVLVHT